MTITESQFKDLVRYAWNEGFRDGCIADLEPNQSVDDLISKTTSNVKREVLEKIKEGDHPYGNI